MQKYCSWTRLSKHTIFIKLVSFMVLILTSSAESVRLNGKHSVRAITDPLTFGNNSRSTSESSGMPVNLSSVTIPQLKLSNGYEIPMLALGTYLGFDKNGVVTSKNKTLEKVVKHAIDIGYRHVDTAAIYQTEEEVGEAMRSKIMDNTVTREDLFVTTKLWNTHHSREDVSEACLVSLKKLGLDYIDLYLIHWPMGLNSDYSYSDVDYLETWRAAEDLVNRKLVRSIGLSNFNKTQIERILRIAAIKPSVLEIEVHPENVQKELVEFAQSQGMAVMGYSPFGSLVTRHGMKPSEPKEGISKLITIARKYNKTRAQIVLRWLIDRNIIPIPKTVTLSRLEENINVFDFKLTSEEVDTINSFDSETRYTLPSFWQDHPHYPFKKVQNPLPNPFAQ